MTKHDHQHGQDHGHHHPHGKQGKGLHKDWRAWAVVLLMLGAMAIYVLTGDEAIQPGETIPGEQMPAAPAAP